MDEIVKYIKSLVAPDQRICFVSGNFNIVHPGHLRLLRFASEQADFLVVGVLSDRIGNALLSENLRLEGIQATSWVDYAFILDNSLEKFISELKPNFVVKGKEHENLFNAEKSILGSYGGKLLFSSGDVSFSSLELLKNETLGEQKKQKLISSDYLKRHNISTSKLKKIIYDFDKLKVIVIGETIVDEYITCEVVGMSQEDPTIVVAPLFSDSFLGAAGIVAAHQASLGSDVHLFTIVGNDESSYIIERKIKEYGIKGHLIVDETRPTIKKQRFRSKNKNLLRVNYLHNQDISKELQEKLFKMIKEVIDEIDLVIFSDYNYGCLPQELVERLTELFKSHGTFIVADSQSSSQTGDVSRFRDMNLLTPTEREARLALNDYNSGLVVLAEKLRKKTNAKNILLTLGSEGIIIHSVVSDNWLTDKLPAFNTNPKDESGAGDSFLAFASLSMALTNNIWISSYLGSLASGIQVSRLGNVPISKIELFQKIYGINYLYHS